MLQAGIIHVQSIDGLQVMESGIKTVSSNINTEPSCELAASSSQNSLPGGSTIAASSSQNSLPVGALWQ